MKNEHITHILDEFSLDSLNESDLTIIKTHIAHCENCRESFKAANVSAVLLKMAVAETFVPPPFFETRLMAAWRDRQIKSVEAFRRWWQASNAVVSAMIITVAVLLLITLVAPTMPNQMSEQASTVDSYSTDNVILNMDLHAELTTNQALQIIYEQQKLK